MADELKQLFAGEARTAFDYLIHSYGFRCTAAIRDLVCYKSRVCAVFITRGYPANELCVELHPVYFGVTAWCVGYDLFEAMEIAGADWPNLAVVLDDSDLESLRHSMGLLAEALQSYAAPLLQGDRTFMAKLRRHRKYGRRSL